MNKRKKVKNSRSFGEEFDKRFGAVEFLDRGEALRIANEIIMEDKDAKMRAAQEKLRETREANRIAAQKMLEEEAAKKRWVRPEMPQEPSSPEIDPETPSEILQPPEIEKKDMAMKEAQQRLEEERKNMFAPGKPILVDHSRVLRGEKYKAGLKVGDRVHFRREFGHYWDPTAVAVLREDGLKIGYLDVRLSTDMARDINKRIVYAAEFVSPTSERECSLFRMV